MLTVSKRTSSASSFGAVAISCVGSIRDATEPKASCCAWLMSKSTGRSKDKEGGTRFERRIFSL